MNKVGNIYRDKNRTIKIVAQDDTPHHPSPGVSMFKERYIGEDAKNKGTMIHLSDKDLTQMECIYECKESN